MNLLAPSMFLLAADEAGSEVAEAAAEQAATGLPPFVALLIVIAVLVLPFVIGQLLANALKLKDLGFRMGVVLFAVTLGLSPFVTRMATGGNWRDAINLGIDLAGGTNMVFQVDREAAEAMEKDVNAELMDKMVGAVGRRINPSGTEEVTVRRVGQDRIEVIVPGADPERVERIKDRIVKLGSLEFAILANQFEHQDLINQARQLPDEERDLYRGTVLVAKWRPVARTPDGEPKPVGAGDGVAFRDVQRGDETIREFLVVVDPDPGRRITGRFLTRAYETMSDSGPAVGFTFNTQGGYLFQQLTARYQPREGAGYRSRLAILLSDEVHSAPTINAIIGASGIIQGQFDQQELNELINVLNAGALEVPLVEQPINEFSVSPLLGVDVQEKGLSAIMWALIAVFIFTLGYYMFAGMVADICLVVNIIMVVGVMSLIDATFTLPGLAGLVLTIGMAVDANVLIFERMREEQEKGSSLRMCIKNGFDKAFSTIVDANVTTLITAIVLYVIGTDQVKGFAVALFVGILMSMFSALFVGRLIFDICERKRWIKSLKMFGIVHAANYNFIGKKRFAAMCSAVLIAVGLVTVFSRGSDNLDIDFRGGAMVTFRFEGENEPTVDDVRAALESQFDSNITLEQLALTENGEEQTLFRMRTTEKDARTVSEGISTAFDDSPYDLVRQHVTLADVETIPEEATSEETTEEDATRDPFAGGSRVEVSLSQPMTVETFIGSFADALGQIQREDGAPRYDNPEAFLEAEGAAAGGPTEKQETIIVRARPNVPQEDFRTALASLKSEFESKPLFDEVNTFDSAVAGETQTDALLAMLFSLVAIIAYLWIRFQRVTFGLAAVVALVHDVLCVLGLVALAAYASGNSFGQMLGLIDFKINLPMVAAFLTIVGYSLNDTIVVFDRIREERGKNPAMTDEIVNRSLNKTLSRTLLTSFTTLLVVFLLYAMGGEGVRGFAFCLILGVMVGTYSSIFVASPVLVWLMNRDKVASRPAAAA
ncbi:bifunctional preprotein translocase subunit SecD/SecF [Maioricimonas rarisocia]|uniref:Multifunctional fusion protein n=1 Tax=Maioricimonas rarisocia TaxID=2528026 RepID=A0A517Z9F4_9PLAN|nr:protein translocase subunit SecD [Maioricimonas rarisocia]QDU39115.1 bifunctional preprotein translocase subunit SecD/SecF [Maioricimonas rarisocia]